MIQRSKLINLFGSQRKHINDLIAHNLKYTQSNDHNDTKKLILQVHHKQNNWFVFTCFPKSLCIYFYNFPTKNITHNKFLVAKDYNFIMINKELGDIIKKTHRNVHLNFTKLT
jgi:hypothetical protein